MRLAVALDEHLPRPVETVWRALTDAAAISEWLTAAATGWAGVGASCPGRRSRRSTSSTGPREGRRSPTPSPVAAI
jgi:uncharacterized protein YndB with AHSA1/START domain